MSNQQSQQLGRTLWAIADQLRGMMDADDFRDYMLSLLFLRYLSDNYEKAARKELGADYPADAPEELQALGTATPLVRREPGRRGHI
jgi:type I restriction enzyme M protein